MSDNTKTKMAPEVYNIKFPKNTLVKLRVREATNEKAKKTGARMHKLILEVIENAPVKFEGADVDINGLDFMHFAVLSEKSLPFYNRVRQAFGFNDVTPEEINTSDANDYKGQVCYALVESEEVERINEATGEKVLDPYTNKVMTTSQRRVTDWVPKPKE